MKALIHENVALAPLTTFGIGGPAPYFIDAPDEETVVEAIRWAKEKVLPIFVLGGGSNLLIADTGFPGLVIRIGIRGIEWARSNGKTIVRAGAGEEWDPLVALCVERNLAGLECLSGIPGSVGGTPVQNVGAYGQEISEVLLSVRAYDRSADRIVELSHDGCGFTYRTSLFNTTAKDRYAVLNVTYALSNGGLPHIRYPELQREFEGKTANATLETRHWQKFAPLCAGFVRAKRCCSSTEIPIAVAPGLSSRIRSSQNRSFDNCNRSPAQTCLVTQLPEAK